MNKSLFLNKKILSGVVLILLLLTIYKAFDIYQKSKKNIEKKPESEFPEKIIVTKELVQESGITVVEVKREDIQDFISLVGEVAFDPDRVSQISARIPGRISKVDFVEGSSIRQGQALVEMESPEASRLRSKYLSSLARSNVAERNLKRVRELSQMRLTSEQEVLNAEGEWKVLDAELRTDKTNLSVQGIPIPDVNNPNDSTLGKIVIRSPLNGIALSRDAIPGKQVDINSILGVVGDISHVWFLVKIFEKDLAFIDKGSPAKITLNAMPDILFEGEIANIGNQVDPGSRTLSGRIILKNPEFKAKIGLFGKAEIQINRKNVLAIQKKSIFEWSQKKHVFIQTGILEYTAKEVELGNISGDMVEVISGITEGDIIVTDGAFTLKSIYLKTTFGED
jgi:membrane fusion protein, heavy metal efflux system